MNELINENDINTNMYNIKTLDLIHSSFSKTVCDLRGFTKTSDFIRIHVCMLINGNKL